MALSSLHNAVGSKGMAQGFLPKIDWILFIIEEWVFKWTDMYSYHYLINENEATLTFNIVDDLH